MRKIITSERTIPSYIKKTKTARVLPKIASGVILVVLLLTGCSSSMDKAKQDYACRDAGGVYSYAGVHMLQCMDGSHIVPSGWRNQILPEEFYPRDK